MTAAPWELNIHDDPFDSYELNRVFAEFVDTLTELAESCYEPGEFEVFTEDKVDTGGFKQAVKRTAETTAMAAKAYDDVTTGMGSALYHSSKLTLRILGLAMKLIGFICKLIGSIPRMIDKVLEKTTRVTKETWHKLTGKMDLWITDKAVALFEREIKEEVDHFLRLCKIFSNKSPWNEPSIVTKTAANAVKAGVKVATLGKAGTEWVDQLTRDDFKVYKAMVKIHNKISRIRYEKTTIPIKGDYVRDTYFTKDSDYFKKMRSLNEFFASKTPELLELQQALKDKITNAEGDGSFFQLKGGNRDKAFKSIDMVGKFMTLIGKYFQYVREDLKTLSNHMAEADKSEVRQELKDVK